MRQVPSWAAVAGAVALALPWLWGLSYLLPPLDGDVAAILSFAVRMVDGDRLYVDLVDVNPPLIFWLNLAPAWIAARCGLDPAVALIGLVLLLQAASLALCRAPATRLIELRQPAARALVAPVVLFAILILPTGNFGQREPLMTSFALPYLALAALRLQGERVAPGAAVLRAGFAAVGFLIKPYFLAVPLVVELCLLLRGGTRAWLRRPEPFVIAALALAYAAVAWRCHPAYFSEILPLVGRYYVTDDPSMSIARVFGAPARWALLGAVAPAIVWGLVASRRPVLTVAGLFTLGGVASALVQGKGWPYHVLPFQQGATLVLTLAAAAALGRIGARTPAPRTRLAAAGLFGLAVALFTAAHPPWRDRLDYEGSFAGRLEALVERDAPGQGVLWLTDAIYPKYPVLLYGRARPASRFMELWLIDGLYRAEAGRRPSMRPPALMSDDERRLFDMVGTSLERDRPALVLVASAAAELGVAADQFDYLAYFLRHPSFAREWRHYREVAVIDGTRVFRRIDPAPPALPGRPAGGRRSKPL